MNEIDREGCENFKFIVIENLKVIKKCTKPMFNKI